MKKTLLLKLTAAIICSISLFSSCKNDTEIVDLKDRPTAADFQALRKSALNEITQTKTFKAEEGLFFTSKKGATIEFYPNCITKQNGDLVQGDVKLSFVEIYDRGNMVLTNKPVMGKNQNGDLLPLITGGQYNIKLTQGDEELKSGCLFHVKIPASNTGRYDFAMKLWFGNIDDKGNIIWEEDDRQKEGGLNGDELLTNYSIFGDTFGWTNVDRFYNDSRPQTKIKVTVPEGFNDSNSAVYLAYEDQPNLLAQLDEFNTSEKYFTEHYGFVPVDLNLHVIFVSENNNTVAYAIKKVKIAANATINISDDEIKSATKDQVIALINGLN